MEKILWLQFWILRVSQMRIVRLQNQDLQDEPTWNRYFPGGISKHAMSILGCNKRGHQSRQPLDGLRHGFMTLAFLLTSAGF